MTLKAVGLAMDVSAARVLQLLARRKRARYFILHSPQCEIAARIDARSDIAIPPHISVEGMIESLSEIVR